MYEDILKFPELKKFAEEKLEDYNMEPGVIPMSLVLFRDAIEHGMQHSCGFLGGTASQNNRPVLTQVGSSSICVFL